MGGYSMVHKRSLCGSWVSKVNEQEIWSEIRHQYTKSFQTSYCMHLRVSERFLLTDQYIKITLALSDLCNSLFESLWHADLGFHFRFLVHLFWRYRFDWCVEGIVSLTLISKWFARSVFWFQSAHSTNILNWIYFMWVLGLCVLL